MENGDETFSSEEEISDEVENSSKEVIGTNEIIEKVFRGYDLKGFSFPPPSNGTSTIGDNTTNGIGS